MFEAMGRTMYRRRHWVLAVAVAFLAFAGLWGTKVFGDLSSGGFTDPASESYRAAQTGADRLGPAAAARRRPAPPAHCAAATR
jgi:RND superfamily putative drug exporter